MTLPRQINESSLAILRNLIVIYKESQLFLVKFKISSNIGLLRSYIIIKKVMAFHVYVLLCSKISINILNIPGTYFVKEL